MLRVPCPWCGGRGGATLFVCASWEDRIGDDGEYREDGGCDTSFQPCDHCKGKGLVTPSHLDELWRDEWRAWAAESVTRAKVHTTSSPRRGLDRARDAYALRRGEAPEGG